MRNQVADIHYEITGSELIALLKESDEIKYHSPLYNRKQRRKSFNYGLYSFTDQNGYVQFRIDKTCNQQASPLVCFSTRAESRKVLQAMIDKYNLCQKLCGTYPSSGCCFHYEIRICRGACIGKEKPSSYNLRAYQVIRDHNFGNHNLIIIDKGRNPDEKSSRTACNGRWTECRQRHPVPG